MSFNQVEFFESLEELSNRIYTSRDKSSFVFELLALLGISKTTISMLKKEDSSNNVARYPESGEVANKRRIYFKPVAQEDDLLSALDKLKKDPLIQTHKIRIVMVTDYEGVLAFDTKLSETLDCDFKDLYKEYSFLLPLAGLEKSSGFSEYPADIQASEKMGRLFDHIKRHNHFETDEDIHHLNVFLTRLLFCFFADDTGIFNNNEFYKAIRDNTKKDGSDLDVFFSKLFGVLDAPYDSEGRLDTPKYLKRFPYVNGGLFSDKFTYPDFTARARRILLDCAQLNWAEINPDIFGSMFQAVIDPRQRGSLGQHYTSVSNILKVIQPLFLEEAYSELESLSQLSNDNRYKNNKAQRLDDLLHRIGDTQWLDITCGSGNFLLTVYRELRQLEIEVLKAKQDLLGLSNEELIASGYRSVIKLENFHGMEIDHFASEIARLALWLCEHQMNMKFKELFGDISPTLPLSHGGHIILADSLEVDWNKYVPNDGEKEIYVIGNPPYSGRGSHTENQRKKMSKIFNGFKKYKGLDYVSCWVWKGAQYIAGTKAKMAFVTTSSITQGGQVSKLFPPIYDKGVGIDFAYQSFPWQNNAKYNAAVQVVIIGFSAQPREIKPIYKLVNDVWHKELVKNISPYLIAGPNVVVQGKANTIQPRQKMVNGSMARDGGRLFLDAREKDLVERKDPTLKKYIRPVLGAREFLYAEQRWCFWLEGESLSEVMKYPLLKERLEDIRKMRTESSLASTNKAATKPHEFVYISQPSEGSYILVPRVSSEKRPYIPIGFFSHEVICTDRNQLIPNGTLYDFGILNSVMHNDWMRLVTGRLKNDFNYSNTIVYNTFPYPSASEDDKERISRLAQNILLVRETHVTLSLSELYDPDTMPDDLKMAHRELDSAIDSLYRPQGFVNTEDRLQHLLARYAKLAGK